MNTLKVLIFWLVLVLIKIGDSVLFLLTLPKLLLQKQVSSLKKKRIKKPSANWRPLFFFRNFNISFHLVKPIKKKRVLYKAPKPKNWQMMMVKKTGKKTWRETYKTSYALLKAALLITGVLFDFLLFLIQTALLLLKVITYPLFAFYRLDKKSRAIFAKEQEHLKEIEEERKRAEKKPSIFFVIKVFLWGAVFAAFFIFLPLLALIFLTDLPNPSTLSVSTIPKTTKIFDRNGKLLYEIFANQNRTIVPLSKIPQNLRNATIAIEDRDFYTHPGFDIRGIMRALVSDATNNEFQGGSTITQQLVKSSLLTSEPSISRKVKELVLAFWTERIYNKDKILELYFNYVPYGGTAWGVEAASEVYFGKHVEELNLAESAFLAGLPRAPSIYSPYSEYADAWKKRQKDVLDAMAQEHYISSSQEQDALSTQLTFTGPNNIIKAPHFVMYVKSLLEQRYGLSEVERGGLQVKTTLDSQMQDMAEQVVSSEVDADASLNISNGSSLILDPRNGDILAMVGSRDYFDMEHDGNVNLTTALRQPGSTIKVVTYSLALSSGYTQTTLLDDSPLSIPQAQGPAYTPVNYDGRNHGNVPLRIAFANSFNITAVRVAQKLGVGNIVEQGQRLGITSWNQPQRYGLSITLGAAETSMLDLATVYSTVANGGKKNVPNPILEIKDANGSTIYKKAPEPSQVLDPGVAFIISDILSDNAARSIEFGTNSPLNIPGHRVSVKTGTTDSKRDNWTVGFTPNIVVATWVGNNDNSPMSQALASGITGAAPMWNKIMTNIISKSTDGPLLIPDDIVKKPCYGKDVYFLQGTDTGASCIMPPSTTPTPTPGTTALAR
ncbi:MAG: transglycosylase domain-containing protein [Candidatus Levyibacteriota bacterium]